MTTDTVNDYQLFRYDKQTQHMEIVSRGNDGAMADASSAGVVSDDGRIIGFNAGGIRLAAGQQPVQGAFLRDTSTNTTVKLPNPTGLATSISQHGISGDGSKILYIETTQAGTPANNYTALATKYLYDRTTGNRIALPYAADKDRTDSVDSISDDGKFAIYTANETPRDPSTRRTYLYDVQAATSTVLSTSQTYSPIFSSDAAKLIYWQQTLTNINGQNVGRWDLVVQERLTGERTILDSINDPNGSPSCLTSASSNASAVSYCKVYGTLTYKQLATGDGLTMSGLGTGAVLSGDGLTLAYDKTSGWDGNDGQVYTSRISAPDTTPPTIDDFTWQSNPKTVGQSSSVSVGVSDDISGIASGEYYLGDNDPGQGNGAAMALSNGSLSATIGTDYPTGVYKFNVRAKDNAGNWSEPKADYLVVYDPSSPLGITGRSGLGITPRLANGDKLPGLVRSNQGDTASFGFTADFRNGALNQNNDLQFSYNTGLLCFTPFASNCHRTSVNANAISWLLFDQDNDSRGRFAGTARVVVDGVTTNNPFSVEGIDGQRLTPQVKDSVIIKVYAPGANVNSAEPLYQASGSLQLSNGVRIR